MLVATSEIGSAWNILKTFEHQVKKKNNLCSHLSNISYRTIAAGQLNLCLYNFFIKFKLEEFGSGSARFNR